MPLPVFSLRSILPTLKFCLGHANDLSQLGSKTSRGFALAKPLSFAVPVLSLSLHGDSLAAQAPLAKISIRSKIRQWHFLEIKKNVYIFIPKNRTPPFATNLLNARRGFRPFVCFR